MGKGQKILVALTILAAIIGIIHFFIETMFLLGVVILLKVGSWKPAAFLLITFAVYLEFCK